MSNNDIVVTFRKDKDGQWHSYTRYGVDCEPSVEFLYHIGKGLDALNKKGWNDE